MNDQEKMEAILASDQVNNYLPAKNLYRIMYGDLSRIGDAISEGKVILYDGSPATNVGFVDDVTCYTIKQPTIMFNGCEINAPIYWKDYNRLQLVVVASTHTTSEVTYSTAHGPYDDFKRGIVFRTEDDAQAYRKAAGWIV